MRLSIRTLASVAAWRLVVLSRCATSRAAGPSGGREGDASLSGGRLATASAAGMAGAASLSGTGLPVSIALPAVQRGSRAVAAISRPLRDADDESDGRLRVDHVQRPLGQRCNVAHPARALGIGATLAAGARELGTPRVAAGRSAVRRTGSEPAAELGQVPPPRCARKLLASGLAKCGLVSSRPLILPLTRRDWISPDDLSRLRPNVVTGIEAATVQVTMDVDGPGRNRTRRESASATAPALRERARNSSRRQPGQPRDRGSRDEQRPPRHAARPIEAAPV